MTQSRWLLWLVCLSAFLVVTGCKNEGSADNLDEHHEQVQVPKEHSETSGIEITHYAEEVGFSLESPTKETNQVETVLHIKGTINKADELNNSFVWLVLKKSEPNDEMEREPFGYYIPIENGSFSREVTLPYGEGDYEAMIRLPSDDSDEEDIYYDGATFSVINLSNEIEREVEYTKYGISQGLSLSKPVDGWNEAEETILLEGTVAEEHEGDLLLIEIKKETEKKELLIPIQEGSFSEDIPLYFGEGPHLVRLRLLAEDKQDVFYESASFYVKNHSSEKLAEMVQHTNFLETGIVLESPGNSALLIQEEKAYPIKGMIDKDAEGADDLSHIIVRVDHIEEEEESTYVIPVENYSFEGMAYFRFGPGTYQVTLNTPAEEQEEASVYYFSSVLSIEHQVEGVEDERNLLPSRGIETDHPAIMSQAEDITMGIEGEREKAKAIFEFVSRHVSYDVEKAEKDVFNIDDSALTTLQSGTGICQDYAFLATALLRSIDIEARFVEGYAGERHAWVEAKLDGEWVTMDPTWASGYVYEGEFYPEYNEAYFDPAPEFLAETHTREGVMY